MALPLLALGCSANPDYGPVSGTVTLDGEPLASAGVTFKPNEGPIATAVTNAEGAYQLKTGSIDGALIGEHRVTIAKFELVVQSSEPAGEEGGPRRASGGMQSKWYTPERYSRVESSGLMASVKSGTNRFPFDLSTTPTK